MQKIKLGTITLIFGLIALTGLLATPQALALASPDGSNPSSSATTPASATSTPAATPATTPTATSSDPKTDACAALKQLDPTKSCDGKDTSVNKLVSTVISILSLLVGIVAVIMVIIGGFKYVTSSGDPNNVTSAKNTLLYALVGLFIAGIAQFLVHFVLRSTQ